MGRSKRGQNVHDKRVRQEANKRKRQGFNVRADIPGFPKPPTVGGYRPDVDARKGSARKLIEVETPESKNSARDKGQQAAFRQAARRNKNTKFRRVVADE